MSTARRDDTPRGPDLAVFRLPGGSGEVHVDPTAYADPRAWAIILAELPDHVARAYTSNLASGYCPNMKPNRIHIRGSRSLRALLRTVHPHATEGVLGERANAPRAVRELAQQVQNRTNVPNGASREGHASDEVGRSLYKRVEVERAELASERGSVAIAEHGESFQRRPGQAPLRWVTVITHAAEIPYEDGSRGAGSPVRSGLPLPYLPSSKAATRIQARPKSAFKLDRSQAGISSENISASFLHYGRVRADQETCMAASQRPSPLTPTLQPATSTMTRSRVSERYSVSNFLSSDKQAMVIAMLCEGMGIRPIERVADVHRDTIMRLGRDVGEGYARLHDKLFVNLSPARVELDEAWSFVHTKQGRLGEDDPKDYGDQYSFIALDADTKAILAYHVGKRNKPNTIGFALDLASRLVTEPQITSDGFDSYKDAIHAAFGPDADYAMLIKEYKSDCAAEAAKRFSPAEVTRVQKIVVSGEPEEDDINTAFVERQNLTLRMLTRRFNRLTNAHSKTLRNHRAAFDLYVGYYNFCWVHSTLKRTPAMAAGIADRPWDPARLISETKHLAHPYDEPIRPGAEKYADYVRTRQQAKKKGGRR